MTQKERILNHLEKYGSITSWEAIREYGITRLSQYIYLLRNENHLIVDEIENSINRFGEKVHYKKYILKEN